MKTVFTSESPRKGLGDNHHPQGSADHILRTSVLIQSDQNYNNVILWKKVVFQNPNVIMIEWDYPQKGIYKLQDTFYCTILVIKKNQ